MACFAQKRVGASYSLGNFIVKEVFTTHSWSDFHAWLTGGWHPERDNGGMLGPRLGGASDRCVRGGTGPRHGRFMGTGQQAERYCKCIAFDYVFFLAI